MEAVPAISSGWPFFDNVPALTHLRLPAVLSRGIKGFFKRLSYVLAPISRPSSPDKKLVPLFQEEDHQQRALIGLVRDREAKRTHQHTPT